MQTVFGRTDASEDCVQYNSPTMQVTAWNSCNDNHCGRVCVCVCRSNK